MHRLDKTLFEDKHLLLILITIIISFSWLGLVGLFDVDEAVFAQATKEMLERGDFITPYYNDIKRYDKPILIYWLMAISFKIFGINEIGARFISPVSGCFLVYFMYKFLNYHIKSKELINVSFYSVLTFVLSIYYFVYSHAAVTDMLLILFISLSLFNFYNFYIERNDRYIYHFMIFSGLGFLTKGLIAIVLPGLIIFLFLLIKKELKLIFKFLKPKFILTFCIIGLPWYIMQLIINGREFIDNFIIKHHFKRYTEVISSHSGPIYYFIITLMLGTFPWFIYLIKNIKKIIFTDNDLIKFSIIWFLTFFIFFSLSKTKLPNYILGGLPAFFILIGYSLHFEQKNSFLNNLILSVGYVIILISILFLHDKYSINTYVALIFLFIITVIYLLNFMLKHINFIFASVFLTLIFISYLVMPLLYYPLQKSLYDYSLYIKNNTNENEKVLLYKLNKPSILFHSDRKAISINKRDELTNYSPKELPKFALSHNKEKDIKVLLSIGYHIKESDKQFVLYEKAYN